MKFTLSQVAAMLGGTVEGNPDAQVWQLAKIEEGSEGSISFLANPKYTHFVYTTAATAVIVADSFVPEQPFSCSLIRVPDPYVAFASLLKKYNMLQLDKHGISPAAFIEPDATVPDDCYIGPMAYIGHNAVLGHNVKVYPHAYVGDNCRIADGTTLFAGVKLYSYTQLGANCIVHAGAVLGADGFGFAPKPDGSYEKIDQIGAVVVEDNVEIGANTCIDRATMGTTVIHRGAKLDNLCQIAHNVVIGSNTVMAAQSGVAGSSKVGERCILAGQVGIVGHIDIGDGVTIGAQSGVTHSVKSDTIVLGTPAIEAHRQRRLYVHQLHIDELAARIDALEKQLSKAEK